ncbi:methyltransferase domain-containing protein [Gordonia sp. X0973]|uniref:methyltransferase domain-containing protein n=1 Tax=Gordonia sp. X0973 TaxID=2742602 RepID=UPI0026575D63|nr:methyltransferase domain-containing protein [Gordonia sp. X0973]
MSSDTAAMIAARRDALDSPPYRALRDAVARTVADGLPATSAHPLLVDAGCGTGQYLASCLDARDDALGLGLDLSKYAARATAGAHRRAAAVVADLWQPWPVADGSAAAVVSVFAPRGFDEVRRVLEPGGFLVVVTPRPEHLGELVEPMGMVGVEPDKHERLSAGLARAGFASVHRAAFTRCDDWGAAEVADAVAMGPSAFHAEPDRLRARAAELVGPAGSVAVTLSVDLTVARS